MNSVMTNLPCSLGCGAFSNLSVQYPDLRSFYIMSFYLLCIFIYHSFSFFSLILSFSQFKSFFWLEFVDSSINHAKVNLYHSLFFFSSFILLLIQNLSNYYGILFLLFFSGAYGVIQPSLSMGSKTLYTSMNPFVFFTFV